MLDWVRRILCKPCNFPDVEPLKVRQFISERELKEFLSQDKIDKRKYVATTYDCDDFAFDLTQAARRKGYDVWPHLTRASGSWHCMNCTLIGNIFYVIEPQNDKITLRVRRD